MAFFAEDCVFETPRGPEVKLGALLPLIAG
jgi:hypothetical protein